MEALLPELDRDYSAHLSQNCTGCKWQADRLRRELTHCPECGRPVGRSCELNFGGLIINYNGPGRNFDLIYPAGRQEVTIQDADFPEALRFMLRNYYPWEPTVAAIQARLGLPPRLKNR
jgi:hypothetical protein